MPSINNIPKAIAGISTGKQYTVQNQTRGQVMFLCVKETRPDGTEDNTFQVQHLESPIVSIPSAAHSVWAWIGSGMGFAAVDEAT